MICNKKSWPLPYRWAEVPWIMEVRVIEHRITQRYYISTNVHQDAEKFLKTHEGAKMLKIHQVEKEDQDDNEEVGGLELQ